MGLNHCLLDPVKKSTNHPNTSDGQKNIGRASLYI